MKLTLHVSHYNVVEGTEAQSLQQAQLETHDSDFPKGYGDKNSFLSQCDGVFPPTSRTLCLVSRP